MNGTQTSPYSVSLIKQEDTKNVRIVKWRILKVTVVVLLFCYVGVFHYVRGDRILPTTEGDLQSIFLNLPHNSLVQSQSQLNDIGRLAWFTVNRTNQTPGIFYLKYLSKLDNLERFHHLIHQPFTGYQTLFTDIWINSASVYGTVEPSWGIGDVQVNTANSLAMFLLIIDRLQRGYSSPTEHIQCYFEIFSGMDYYTTKGKAEVYKRVLPYAAKSVLFRNWLIREIHNRPQNLLDRNELSFWNNLATRLNKKYKVSVSDIRTSSEIIQVINYYLNLPEAEQLVMLD